MPSLGEKRDCGWKKWTDWSHRERIFTSSRKAICVLVCWVLIYIRFRFISLSLLQEFKAMCKAFLPKNVFFPCAEWEWFLQNHPVADMVCLILTLSFPDALGEKASLLAINKLTVFSNCYGQWPPVSIAIFFPPLCPCSSFCLCRPLQKQTIWQLSLLQKILTTNEWKR